MRRPSYYLKNMYGNMPIILGDKISAAVDKAPFGFYFTDAKDFVVAPPFRRFMVEYKAKFHDSDDHITMCITVIVDDDKSDSEDVRLTIQATKNILNMPDEDFLCLLTFNFFFEQNNQLRKMHGGGCTIILDKTGHPVFDDSVGGVVLFSENKDEKVHEVHTNEMTTALYILSLMSCRSQIELVPAPFSRQQRRQMERNGEDPTIYKVLKVKAGKKYPALERLLSGQAPITDKRLHLVRGHFKHYDNLFGKYEGVFYWEPHYRGNENVGKVDKDYEVEMPDES